MSYTLQDKDYYKNKSTDSIELFEECWRQLLIDKPNYDTDEDVMGYLDIVAVELVNDPDSEFYIHG